MAKLALISSTTYRSGLNEIGDIVDVFDDNQPIQATCLAQFDWVIIPDETKSVRDSNPMRVLYRAQSVEWTETPPESKQVWKGEDGKYREIVRMVTHPLNYDSKTGKISETFSRYPENNKELL
jgi:hypothetical protein